MFISITVTGSVTMKKILIISSEHTGHGHKSITEALNEYFPNYPDVSVHVIDGFSLAGNFGLRVGKLYGSVTRNAKDVWKMFWEISIKNPKLINDFVELVIKENLLNVMEEVKPDIIISVHPNYITPVINILEEYNIKIPFITIIADLVSISPLWADPRSDYTICPTVESKERCLEFGVPEPKLKVIGFPVRSRFNNSFKDEGREYKADRPLNCLIMSGGEGVGNMSTIAKILLNNFDARVKIIAGRNNALRKRLERTLVEKYGDKVEVYGFVTNLQDLMASSDIAFTRGSPNVAMEAIACAVPLVITGALPGQEEGNPGYIEKYNLGVSCESTRQLKRIVNELLEDNAKMLNSIRQSQIKFRNPDVAKNIVDFIMSIESKNNIISLRFPSKPEKVKKVKEVIRARRDARKEQQK